MRAPAMKTRGSLLALLLAASVSAQTSAPAPARRNQAAPAAATKTVRPDPNLLDGSKLEAEKRPMYGMLSEIEMGEQEGGKPDRVSPNSGPGGGSGEAPPPGGKAGSPPPPAGGSAEKVEEGPPAEAQGAQAQKLSGPQGAQAPGGANKQSQTKLGDASLQIQTVKASPDVVGTQPTTTQQYEKNLPAGSQSTNRNQGAEKGKVIPKGL
jgi:hypothetical protein